MGVAGVLSVLRPRCGPVSLAADLPDRRFFSLDFPAYMVGLIVPV